IPSPQFQTKGGLTQKVNHDDFYGTTGVGPDLMTGAQEALRTMIDYVSETYNIKKIDAYLLASLCVDLKISEIVDAGQYVVSALLPLSIFDDSEKSIRTKLSYSKFNKFSFSAGGIYKFSPVLFTFAKIYFK
ncbi:acetamidase/formamidase family protein, partial [Tetragenococcus halophilus]